MKHMILKGGLVTAFLLAAATAWAGWWTSYTAIANLDATEGGGYRVYPVGSALNSGSNPCSHSDYAEVIGSATPEARAEYNRLLLSAFLSGKKVRLFLSSHSSNCIDGRPVYAEVRVDHLQ